MPNSEKLINAVTFVGDSSYLTLIDHLRDIVRTAPMNDLGNFDEEMATELEYAANDILPMLWECKRFALAMEKELDKAQFESELEF